MSMANLEINAASSVCRKCGRAYGRLKGYFPICYAYLYKGVGYLPYCSDCCKQMFDAYYAESGDERMAIRQLCRKMDLYWSDALYEQAARKTGTRTVFQNYIARLNNASYAGKSYDDTLREEKTLWAFWERPAAADAAAEQAAAPEEAQEQEPEDEDVVLLDSQPIQLTDEIVAFWGQGLTPSMYRELEQRRRFYKEQMGEDAQLDMSTEMLLRQIAMAEVDINKARAAGVSVDKLMSSLNSMLSNLKKPQKSAAAVDAATGGTPFGVWIKRWEDERPIPEADEEFKDVDGIVKYVTVWMFGHLCKMLGIKNSYCRMYEEEIAKLRVERPEYDDEDDDTMLNDLFGGVELEHLQPAADDELDELLYGNGGEPDGGTE